LDKTKINKLTNRITFSSISSAIEAPDLLNIQVESFEDFLQLKTKPVDRDNKGLQSVFVSNFPILDNKEFYRLDFIDYAIEKPRFSIAECEERGLTYSAPLKSRLRLSTRDDETEEFVNTVEQEVYLGNLPYMTERGTFILTVPRELSSVSFTARPVLLLRRMCIRTVRLFIPQELSRSVGPGWNLLPI